MSWVDSTTNTDLSDNGGAPITIGGLTFAPSNKEVTKTIIISLAVLATFSVLAFAKRGKK